MKKTRDLPTNEAEQAALFALGCLDRTEAEACRQRMKESSSFEKEVRSLQETLSQIGDLAPEASPPHSLRSRLMKRIGADLKAADQAPLSQPWKDWRASEGDTNLKIVNREESGWQETAHEGVEVKPLFVDRARDRVTMLVRMAAGCSYPAHRHAGPEECFMLEGDLRGKGFSLQAGDYQYAPAHSAHGRQFTDNGCVVLIISSLKDQIQLGT